MNLATATDAELETERVRARNWLAISAPGSQRYLAASRIVHHIGSELDRRRRLARAPRPLEGFDDDDLPEAS